MPQQEATITFVKGDRVGSETDYRDALPVNMTGVLKPILGADGYMVMYPGLSFHGVGVDVDRGGVWNERLIDHYRVSGESLVSVSAAGASTILGTVPGLDTVSLPYSFNTQGVVADGRFWLYDPVGGFNEVIDPDLGDPIDCVWIDGYYFFTDGENLYHTDIADETQVDPLKFATSEFSPDPTLGVGKTVDNKVIAFNRYSIEYFSNVANPQFAFTRIPSRALKTGIVGTHAKVEVKDAWYVLGGRKNEDISVHVIETGTSYEISTREIDAILAEYTEEQLSTVVMEKRMEKDYHYVVIHLPRQTLVYNVTLGEKAGPDYAWSILKSGVDTVAEWRGKHGIWDPRIAKYVYGDKQSNTLGVLDENVATQYGDIAEWYLYTPFIDLESLSIDEIKLETIPGFGGATSETEILGSTEVSPDVGFDIPASWTALNASVAGSQATINIPAGSVEAAATIPIHPNTNYQVEIDIDTLGGPITVLIGNSAAFPSITASGTYTVRSDPLITSGDIGFVAVNPSPTIVNSLSVKEFEKVPTPDDDAKVFLSTTYDGLFYSMEEPFDYGAPGDYSKNFIIRRVGYVEDWVSLRLRGTSKSRMAFGKAKILYG